VRKKDNEIELKKVKLNTLAMRYKVFKLPLIRGVVGLVESLAFGLKALMYSAEFFDIEEDKEDKPGLFYKLLEKIYKDRAKEKYEKINNKIDSGLDKIFKDKRQDVEIAVTL